ncbi:MAG: hypothetical protein L0H96_05025 [Humibacillus sp.]|nr:hypothetical protein [Humibacillus sp.]MDN5776252.1 hypothetical protein [Humibacillus sp.]
MIVVHRIPVGDLGDDPPQYAVEPSERPGSAVARLLRATTRVPPSQPLVAVVRIGVLHSPDSIEVASAEWAERRFTVVLIGARSGEILGADIVSYALVELPLEPLPAGTHICAALLRWSDAAVEMESVEGEFTVE